MKHTLILLALFLTACDSGKTSTGSAQQRTKPLDNHISVVTSQAVGVSLKCVTLAQWCKYSDDADCLSIKVSAIEEARLDAFYSQYCSI